MMSAVERRKTRNFGQILWERLTEPHASIPEADRLRVRLIAVLSLALALISAAALPAQFFLGSLPSDRWTVLAATASLAAAYFFSRSRHTALSAWLTLLPIFAAPLIIGIANEIIMPLSALCLSVLVASLISSSRLTILTYVLALAAPILFAAWFPQTPFDNILMFSFIIGAVGALALLAGYLRRRDQERIEKQAASLAASEYRYRSLIDNALAGVFQTDREGNVLFVNPELANLLDYQSPAELIGTQVINRYENPQDRTRLWEILEREGEVRNFETSLFTRGNRALTVLISATLEDGKLSGVVRDITERKRVEEALRASEERFRTTLDTMLEGCQIIGFDWRYLYVNDAVVAQSGYRRDELLGRTMMEKYPGIEHTELFAVLERCMRGRVSHRMENEFTFPDGSEGWYDLSIQPVDEGLFILSHDINERKRVEAERLAREIAEEASRAKSEFLSRMSHELRTPLNAILGFAQLMMMDEMKPEYERGVNQIYKSGRHLLDLVNEVLDIARIEAGRMQISPEPVLLEEALHEVLELIHPLAEARRLRLILKIPSSGDVFVQADRQRLKQVLLNLLSNAVKYNREGGAIAVVASLTIEGRLRLQVRDSGEGIPPEKMKRLFIPFDRLGAEAMETEGTGLGLALSKGLVEAMGGRVGAESEVGVGSVFWIELKLVTERLKEVIMAEVDENLTERMRAGRGVVLYVEDNLANVNLVEAIMERLPGVKLITAMQGRIALSLAKEHQPDLVLLDLHLPDIHGAEVLRRLKAEPATRHIPVVVISADAMPSKAEELRDLGARDYLTKPIDVKEFLKVVEEHLGAPNSGALKDTRGE
ncbi:PAS domain S-box protein [Chloroflexi bacterium CFX6]|nr:PAS domain S-box protein [Chloroflexi bacterium CFX6]